jgi:hypothetical protein
MQRFDIEQLLSLKKEMDIDLPSGPRVKKDATNIIELISHALLSKRKDIYFFYKKNNLMVTLGERHYNITTALKAEPDFEQLTFTPEQLQEYVRFLHEEADERPLLKAEKVGREFVKKMMTAEEYQEKEAEIGYDSEILYGAKLGISLYSTDQIYKLVNSFLRNNAQLEDLMNLSSDELQNIVKEIFLVMTIASYGLTQLAPLRPMISTETKSLTEEESKSFCPGNILLTPSEDKEVFANYYYKNLTGQEFRGAINRAVLKRKLESEVVYDFLVESLQSRQKNLTDNIAVRIIIEDLCDFYKNYKVVTSRMEINQSNFDLKSNNYYSKRIQSIEQKKLYTEKAFHSTSILGLGSLAQQANIYSIFHGIDFHVGGISNQKIMDVFSKFSGEYEILHVPGTQMRYLDYKIEDKEVYQEHKGTDNEYLVKALYLSAIPARSIDEYQPHAYSCAHVIQELQKIKKELEDHKKHLSSKLFQSKKSALQYVTTIDGLVGDVLKQYITDQEKDANENKDSFQLSGLYILKNNISNTLKMLKIKEKSNLTTIRLFEKQLNQINNVLLNIISIAPPHVANDWHYQDLLPAIHYVYAKHLCKPYARAKEDKYLHDEKVKFEDKIIIYRPNHGLAHTVRGAFYVPYILDYYANHAVDDQFKNYCKTLTRDELIKIQKALLFVVSGRESDLGFSDNPSIYMGYRKRCGEQFVEFAKQDGWSEKDIKKFHNLVVYYGDPHYTDKYPDNSQNTHYISHIMKLAHNIDLLRCYDPLQFQRDVIQENSELVEKTPAQAEFLKQLVLLAQHSLDVTGDRFFCRMNNGKLDLAPADKIQYDSARFIKASTNPEACLNILTNISFPLATPKEEKEMKRHLAPRDAESLDEEKVELKIVVSATEKKSSVDDLELSSHSDSLSHLSSSLSSQSLISPKSNSELSDYEVKSQSAFSRMSPVLFKQSSDQIFNLLTTLMPNLPWYYGAKNNEFWMDMSQSEKSNVFVEALQALLNKSESGILLTNGQSVLGIQIILKNVTLDNLMKLDSLKQDFCKLRNPDQSISGLFF